MLGSDSMATYIQGNVVRKEPAALPREKRKVTRAKRYQVLHVNRAYVVFLAVATVVALMVCVLYLQLQSSITKRSQKITSLQKEIAVMREENTTKDNEIKNSMNLEEIREEATSRLGMVYATPEQVIEYSSPEEDSVKQYTVIPESGIVASSNAVK